MNSLERDCMWALPWTGSWTDCYPLAGLGKNRTRVGTGRTNCGLSKKVKFLSCFDMLMCVLALRSYRQAFIVFFLHISNTKDRNCWLLSWLPCTQSLTHSVPCVRCTYTYTRRANTHAPHSFIYSPPQSLLCTHSLTYSLTKTLSLSHSTNQAINQSITTNTTNSYTFSHAAAPRRSSVCGPRAVVPRLAANRAGLRWISRWAWNSHLSPSWKSESIAFILCL